MSEYDLEAVDRLPFSTPEKALALPNGRLSRRGGASTGTGTDPTLQFTMAIHLEPDELAAVEPHLTRIGELMGVRWPGGPSETDRNPPRRTATTGGTRRQPGRDAGVVQQSKRAVLDAQQALRTDARAAKVSSGLALFASNYLLNQADIGMGCALGTGGGMVQSLVPRMHP